MRRGVDISSNQKAINWRILKSRPVSFAYIRAKYGFVNDNYFVTNWNQSKDVSLDRGAWNYFLANMDGKAVGESFCEYLDKNGKGELIPGIDLEVNRRLGEKMPVSTMKYIDSIWDWLEVVQKYWGDKPAIYTNGNWIKTYLRDPAFAAYPLWIAYPGEINPVIPLPFCPADWYMWQYSWKGNGTWYGVSTLSIDLDVMR